MSELKKIWLTRPEPDSIALAAKLSPRGTFIAPLTIIAPLAPQLPPKPDMLVLTSRHGAHYLAQLPADWRTLPVYAVGTATASAVRSHHFNHVITGGGNVITLLPELVKLPAGSQLLYLAGTDRSADLTALMARHDIAVTTLEVYRAVASDALGAAAIKALSADEIDSVVFYSPRSARLACQQLCRAGLGDTARHIDAYCLSLAVANAAGLLPWRSLQVAPVPTSGAMVELIASRHTPAVL